MRKMKLLKKRSLQRNIVVLSLTLSLFIAGIFSVFYYHNKQKDLERNLSNYSEALSFQVNQYFNERLHTLVTRVYTLTRSEQFHNIFAEYLSSDLPHQYQLTLTAFNSLISQIKIPDSFISSVYLYTPKDTFYDLSSLSPPQENFKASNLYAQYLEEGAPQIYFGYRNAGNFFYGSQPGIPMIIRAPIRGYTEDIFLVINLNSGVIDSYLTQSTFEGGDVMIVKEGQEIVASSNSAMTETYSQMFSIKDGEISFEKGEYIFSAQKLGIADWFVVTITSRSIIKQTLHSGIGLVFLLQLVSILITFLCALFFSVRIVKPIQDLQQYMTRFTEGEYSLCYDYNDDNEVGRLAQCFNHMVRKIGSLMGELNATISQLQVEKENVRQEQSLKRTAELNALQAQIDPHFLYNTLNSIVWLAEEDESDKISLLADNLSKFYEYRIRGGQALATIRNEIEQVKSYVEIQNIRYGGSIRCQFELEEALLDNMVIKLAIQPLVENSIIHGIQCKENAADIVVRVCPDPDSEGWDIRIEVEDNGIGIPPHRLAGINEYLRAGKAPEIGYGIGNVNERIKLYFGSRYGLRYQSKQGVGTVASIRIPRTPCAYD